MNLLTKLQNLEFLSNNEQVVVDFIINNPEKVISLSANELAKECFVSVPTIYRLCNKLELSGFSELKVKISSSLKDFNPNVDFDFDFPVKGKQSNYHIVNRLKEDYEKTIQSTMNLFDLDQLKKAVQSMSKAKRIDIYTSSGNIYFAQNFQFQMQEIGIQVNVPIDEYMQRLLAASSDSSCFAIIISFGGRGAIVQHIAKVLKEKGTKILLISSNEFNIEGFKPHFQLLMSSYENHYKKISSFSTRLSLLYILDVLYTSYFELNYEENVKKKLEYYAYISKKY